MTNTILERVSHDLHNALLVGLGYNQWISMYDVYGVCVCVICSLKRMICMVCACYVWMRQMYGDGTDGLSYLEAVKRLGRFRQVEGSDEEIGWDGDR